MIESFYGLDSAPFRLTPDPRFFYAGKTHKKALSYMRYGLQQGEGFIVLTGDVGTGKSTLITYLLNQLDRNALVCASLATSNLDSHDLLRMVVKAFGISGYEARKADLLTALTDYVRQERGEGRTVLLIVDEVQNMPRASLEELRMLTDATAGQTAGLQCFLVGQPQFRTTLNDPGMEQLRQRVIGSCHLEPMTVEETRDYIVHRLEVAGWNGRPALDKSVADVIQAATGGVPRRINLLFSRLLVYGAIEKRDRLDGEDCEVVIDDIAAEAGSVEVTSTPVGNGSNHPSLSELERRIDGVETILVELLDTTTALLERSSRRERRNGDGENAV